MRATIYTTIVLGLLCAIGFMYYDSKKEVPVSSTFAQDDEYLYSALRKDLMAYLPMIGTYYAGWNDDEVRANYEAGAPSKSAAFIQMAIKHYPAKAGYYNSLLDNLNNRYKNA